MSDTKNYLIKLICLFLLLIFIVNNNIYLISIFNIFVLLLAMFLNRKNKYVFLIFLLIFFFNLNFIIPMVFDNRDVIYSNYLHQLGYNLKTMKTATLFVFSLFFFIKCKKVDDKKIDFNFLHKYSFPIYISLFFICAIFSVFGINRVKTNSYVVNVSPMYEVTYILIFFMLIMTEHKKNRIFFTILLASLIIFQDLYYGGRITSLQIALVFFAYFIKKIKIIHFIGFFFLLFLFLLVGSLRDGNGISLSEFNVFKINSFYFAYQTSETHILLYENVSFVERVNVFFANIMDFFFIDTGIETNISAISINYANHFYGGYAFSWFYFLGGYFGPIILGLILSLIVNYFSKKQNTHSLLLITMMFVSLPRWYCYDIFIFFKYGVVWTSIAYLMLKIIEKSETEEIKFICYPKKIKEHNNGRLL